MTRKPLVLAGLCVALLAAPAFAQQGKPGGTMAPPATTAPQTRSPTPNSGMAQPNPGAENQATPATHARHVARAKTPANCWDLAWQSQAMNSCFTQHPDQAQQHPQAAQTSNPPSGTPSSHY